MNLNKWKVWLLLVVLLLTSLTVTQSPARAESKPSKPKVRLIGATAIIEPVGTKKNVDIEYAFYSFYKGEWVSSIGVGFSAEGKMGQDILYANIDSNGKHAVTVRINDGRESDKTIFTVTKSKGKAKHDNDIDLGSDVFQSDFVYRYQTKDKSKVALTVNDKLSKKGVKLKLYAVDAKGKMKLLGTKKPTMQNDGFMTAYFKKVKGCRTYIATTVIKGKESNYLHIALDKDEVHLQTEFKGDAFKK